MKDARLLASGDGPPGGIVLASETVEAAARVAGDSELLTNTSKLGNHALGLRPQLQPHGLTVLAIDPIVADDRVHGPPGVVGPVKEGGASAATCLSSRIADHGIRPERRAMPTYSPSRL
ncbi:hypothetical protein [Streptomyces inhibens]|uniref:hypothetical protein n=1 Tax=Streptomyces inhibens TaxID=2293571 RepID=UPI001EE6C71C|nr:hypothetical protein [Streptomyces inhibens]UKY54932.1 hypothetical protein KI385_43380 [Streptomyces inhibens]